MHHQVMVNHSRASFWKFVFKVCTLYFKLWLLRNDWCHLVFPKCQYFKLTFELTFELWYILNCQSVLHFFEIAKRVGHPCRGVGAQPPHRVVGGVGGRFRWEGGFDGGFRWVGGFGGSCMSRPVMLINSDATQATFSTLLAPTPPCQSPIFKIC